MDATWIPMWILYESVYAPLYGDYLDPSTDPIWILCGSLYASYKDPCMDAVWIPVWTPLGPYKDPCMDPYMDPI